MASFSARYPRAVHILPLHALKSIWRSGALLSKASLESDQTAAVRPTTSGVDEALGFQHEVHFYLLGYAQPWEVAPILAAQLGPSSAAPFPHVALECPTAALSDGSCIVCLWNIAVSRPAFSSAA